MPSAPTSLRSPVTMRSVTASACAVNGTTRCRQLPGAENSYGLMSAPVMLSVTVLPAAGDMALSTSA